MGSTGTGRRHRAAWLLLLPAVLVTGLTSCDPTEDVFAVSIANDSAQTVTLKQCDSTCQTVHHTYTIRPGSSVTVNATSENLDEYFSVSNPAGNLLGCLNLKYATKEPNVRVPISSARACPPGVARNSAGPSAFLG
jgi:hypothetical protein